MHVTLTMLDDLIRGQKIKDLFNTGSDEASHSHFNVNVVEACFNMEKGPSMMRQLGHCGYHFLPWSSRKLLRI